MVYNAPKSTNAPEGTGCGRRVSVITQKYPSLVRRSLIVALLVAMILAVFWQVRDYPLIPYDDDRYITENPPVLAGLTLKGVVWAFTTSHMGNWHPLTWLSHMADIHIFGLSIGWHHLVNVFFHGANAVLLFLVLWRMTKGMWQSAFVAALFAVHPLHVESVAWVAERKDVLSTFFWMLTLWSYAGYVERKSGARYLLVMVFFLLGLLSKPMVVTLPFALLLLDYWPLGRTRLAPGGTGDGGERKVSFSRLAREKIPLFLLSLGSCAVTYAVQKAGGAVSSESGIPFGFRVANAAVSYAGYLGKTVWPGSLAVFYPHPWGAHVDIPAMKIAGSVILIGSLTVISLRWALRFPYLVTGWFWYLGTLVPVIGLVQVGTQAMADRYTYIPLTGLFIMVAWGVPHALGEWRFRRISLGAAGVGAILVLLVSSWHQTSYWRGGVPLFERALEVTSSNWVAHFCLGTALASEGKIDGGVVHYREALRIKPDYYEASYNLANARKKQGRIEEAVAQYYETLRINSNMFGAHNNLGIILAERGMLEQAIVHFREALRIRPGDAVASGNLNTALRSRGSTERNSDQGK
jgi:hypothetical protein